MKLVDDWHWIVNHAWSVRLLILQVLLTGVDSAMTAYVYGQPAWLSVAMFVVSGGALASRFVAQKRPEEA